MKSTLQRIFGQGIFYTGWKNAIINLLLAVAVYFGNEVYDLLNHGPAVLNLRTPLDAALPVVPVFVIPYVSLDLIVYATLIFFLLFRTKYFQSATLGMLTLFFISYLFYAFLQSEVVRPVLTGTDVFSKMVMAVYAGDAPYNDFPSLHTSVSTLLAIHWVRLNKPAGIVISLWTVLIVASTLLIKQHYIADMLFSLVLAFSFAKLYLKEIVNQPAAI